MRSVDTQSIFFAIMSFPYTHKYSSTTKFKNKQVSITIMSRTLRPFFVQIESPCMILGSMYFVFDEKLMKCRKTIIATKILTYEEIWRDLTKWSEIYCKTVTFSRTLQLHCKVRLLSWYIVCCLSVCRRLWHEGIVTKRLQVGLHGFHWKVHKHPNFLPGKFDDEIQRVYSRLGTLHGPILCNTDYSEWQSFLIKRLANV